MPWYGASKPGYRVWKNFKTMSVSATIPSSARQKIAHVRHTYIDAEVGKAELGVVPDLIRHARREDCHVAIIGDELRRLVGMAAEPVPE